MILADLALAAMAGIVSTLSPCVLPILPIVVASASGAHRHGVAGLVAGLVTAFTVSGMLVAGLGVAVGFDGGALRVAGAALLACFGMALLVPWAGRRFAAWTAGLGGGGQRLLARLAPSGLSGQFVVGALLGVVWTPCAGPTLGAASLLATEAGGFVLALPVMVAFALGAGLPLALAGLVSRAALLRLRAGLAVAGEGGRRVLGGVAVLVGVLVLTGADHAVEAALLAASPDWLVGLTTRY